MKIARKKGSAGTQTRNTRQESSVRIGHGKDTVAGLKRRLIACAADLQDAKTRVELDVAARVKDLREEIQASRDASRSKDDFIRITNHELRTPLDVIRGNIDMVLKGETGVLPVRTSEYLADALMGADRLTRLVNDMLDISRIESGRMRFVLEEIDIKEILQTIQKEFEPVLRRKGLIFSLHYPETSSLVFSDRNRIFQIIDNFLSNALKFTTAGGHISLTAWD